jgi:V/A-type H+-transporting ATPase subunit I
MAIVPLDKVTLYGSAAQRDAALDALQRLGRLHLLSLSEEEARAPVDRLISAEAREALKYLRAAPIQRHPSKRTRGFDAPTIVRQTLENKRRRQSLADERDSTDKAIENVTPWGEFRLPPVAELGDMRFWFYAVPRRDAKAIAALSAPYQIAAEEPTSLYLVVISPEEPIVAPGERKYLDPRPLSELKTRRAEIDELLEDLDWERNELTRWIDLLQRNMDEADDRAARAWAERLSRCEEDLFALQGWAPCEARAEIEAVAKQHTLAVTFAAPDVKDQPPTLLKNPDRVAGAENAVTFYITPAYRAWDPTPIMFISFSLFFGMIVADAGYGLLMAAALLLSWRKLGKTPNGARSRYLFLAIVIVTIVFGALAGSYFGLAPSAASPLGRLRVLDFENRGQMMGLSILIGVTHLTIANLITAWHARGSARALGSIGWVLVMVGALMMAAKLLETAGGATAAWLGQWVLGLGFLTIVLFSSDRPLRSTRLGDWAGRLMDGLGALTGVSKLFGDVLSYLRLFALGLASAQLAVTFNQLASDMTQFRGLGFLLAAVILIAGHGINLVLGLMGGVVHGLRLNCIEFFNWSLTEEGYPFQAFQKKVSV